MDEIVLGVVDFRTWQLENLSPGIITLKKPWRCLSETRRPLWSKLPEMIKSVWRLKNGSTGPSYGSTKRRNGSARLRSDSTRLKNGCRESRRALLSYQRL